ncbi:helitron helicase-like domain-containing protein [Artemisia annua]|uniref:Helitron helicase-like domain-containing protein n=1 Tax=Artemisia annua TaxID=35608 RepID=A0A2U1P8D9_ARTAN|nr:helitron helicase-like domain-containing protein [Artemisia annua]
MLVSILLPCSFFCASGLLLFAAMNQKTIPFPKKKPSYRLSNPTNTHTSPQCKIHSPNVANGVASDSHGHQSSAASNTDDDYVRQGSVHDASHMQCPPPSVNTPSAQQCTPVAFLQDTLTNGGLKNGGRLLQATGSSQHDNRCLQQPKKRGRPRKDKGTTEPVEEATCVHTDALPDDPQTAAYTNRRSRRTRRQRILMQHFQSSLHSPAKAREEGSSSCTQQDFNGPELDPEIVQGLIHFLDEHNELVQLLRTARDKCAQHDVPEFKLRLYSGERPRGYELPGSHILGAIVFDSGPESESNYDVIIEYRGGVIKRVSKIHKSYMSLQFPLIFIYGQPGYHTKLMLRTADPNDEPKRFIIFKMLLMHVYDVLFLCNQLEALPAPLALTEKDSTEEKKERQDEPHTTATLLSPPSESTKEMELPEDDLQQPNNTLVGNEASSAVPGTPMQFIKQETLPPPPKEKALQETKGKTVKRPLFQQQPAESKKQKGTHRIFN